MTDGKLISVVISESVSDGGVLRGFLDGKTLAFTNGTAEAQVAAGEHSLMWFVLGPPGTVYKLSIDEPASVGFHTGATLNATGSDHGTTWFTV
jgi:hypothetical protein